MSDRRRPDSFIEHDEEIMSNFDGSVDYGVAEFIKGKELFSQYSGWNFCGYVWWQDENWHCEVWCYNSWQDTISEETLEDLMSAVSEDYGHE